MRATASIMAIAFVMLIPAGDAAHCETAIEIHGRTSLLPLPSPQISTLRSACGPFTTVDQHEIPVYADMILVRLNSDLGISYPDLRAEVSGLGFNHSMIRLYRTTSAGGTSYDSQWLSLPNATEAGDITVTLRHQAWNGTSVTYHKSVLR